MGTVWEAYGLCRGLEHTTVPYILCLALCCTSNSLFTIRFACVSNTIQVCLIAIALQEHNIQLNASYRKSGQWPHLAVFYLFWLAAIILGERSVAKSFPRRCQGKRGLSSNKTCILSVFSQTWLCFSAEQDCWSNCRSDSDTKLNNK